MKKLLAWLFTAIYFLIFHVFICLVINHLPAELLTIQAESILTIFCWIIAFFISVALGDFTEKKIREYYSKK